MANFHESYQEKEVKLSSPFSFGVTFSSLFLILGILSYYKKNPSVGHLLITLSLGFIIISFKKVKWLVPLNLIWNKFTYVINGIMHPVILFILYFFLITPLSFFYRVFSKKDFHIKFQENVESYWITKKDYSEANESMKNQF